jgi:hypothetical protein
MRGRAFRLACLTLLAACGSRTGLFLDEAEFGPNPVDGGPTADAARRDASRDGEIVEDALPPLDVTPPQDVSRIDCAEAGTTYIYLISREYQLYSFDPSNNAVTFIGNIACPAPSGETPFSMAVDRKGIAYILFTDEHLYRVSTLNAACLGTSYVPRQSNFGTFGMGFATNEVGPTETLYVYGDDLRSTGAARGLARIDISTFKLTTVGDPGIRQAELTGTGGGNLYAFYTRVLNQGVPSYIGQLDTTTGQLVSEKEFDDVDQGNGWAFAFWGGDFYMFTAPKTIGTGIVTRYRPSNDTHQQIATLPSVIVGAGVSTCAPQQ